MSHTLTRLLSRDIAWVPPPANGGMAEVMSEKKHPTNTITRESM